MTVLLNSDTQKRRRSPNFKKKKKKMLWFSQVVRLYPLSSTFFSLKIKIYLFFDVYAQFTYMLKSRIL